MKLWKRLAAGLLAVVTAVGATISAGAIEGGKILAFYVDQSYEDKDSYYYVYSSGEVVETLTDLGTIENFGDGEKETSILIPASKLKNYPTDTVAVVSAQIEAGTGEGLYIMDGNRSNRYLFMSKELVSDSFLKYTFLITSEMKENGILFTGTSYNHLSEWSDISALTIQSVEFTNIVASIEQPTLNTGFSSDGSSIIDLPVDTVATQKTAIIDGRFGERFIKKVKAVDMAGKVKASFTLSNGTAIKTVSTTKYNTALTVDGETVSAGSGYVFLVYTLSGIPEDVNVTVTGVTLE